MSYLLTKGSYYFPSLRLFIVTMSGRLFPETLVNINFYRGSFYSGVSYNGTPAVALILPLSASQLIARAAWLLILHVSSRS